MENTNYFGHSDIVPEAWLTGDSLVKFMSTLDIAGFKKRHCYKKLKQYLMNRTRDMCALYGIRRTGKTVMIQQGIMDLLESGVPADEIAYLTLRKGTQATPDDIIWFVQENWLKIKYYFIDEITYMNTDWEYNGLNYLADRFAVCNVKIVISGTFSYAIRLLLNDVLFDRVWRIDTTYFSFKEAHEIQGQDLETFIQYGGILVGRDEVVESPESYKQTAIVDNLVQSILKSKALSNFMYYIPDVKSADDKSIAITNLLDRMIDHYMYSFVYHDIVREKYRYSDVGNLADLIRQRSQRAVADGDLLSSIRIDEKPYYQILEEVIGKVNVDDIPEAGFNLLQRVLFELGVFEDIRIGIEVIPRAVTNYLRYGLCEEIATVIGDHLQDETNGLYKTELMLDNVKGAILEGIVYSDLQHTTKFAIDKYRDKATGLEVDLLIKDMQQHVVDLYEIKHSDVPLDEHARHLINLEVQTNVAMWTQCKVRNCFVLYNGQTLSKVVSPTVVFRQMSEERERLGKTASAEQWDALYNRAMIEGWPDVQVQYKNISEFLCEIWEGVSYGWKRFDAIEAGQK